MLNAHAKAWVAALRSKEYKQGRKALCKLVKESPLYCCLGVACDLYRKEVQGTWGSSESSLPTYRTFTAVKGDSEGELLPNAVAKWLGLASIDGLFFFEGGHDGATLVGINDTKGSTFNKIANLIEAEPEGLFGDLDA